MIPKLRISAALPERPIKRVGRVKESVVRIAPAKVNLVKNVPADCLQHGLYEGLFKLLFGPITLHPSTLEFPEVRQRVENLLCLASMRFPFRFEGQTMLQPMTGEEFLVVDSSKRQGSLVGG